MSDLTKFGPLVGIAFGLIVGCGGSTETNSTPGPVQTPAALLIVSGNTQSGTVGTQLTSPLVVRVVDASGSPVQGQVVNFRVTQGGGTVFAGAALTNATGTAQELWTLGTTSGPQQVEARAVDSTSGAGLVFATFDSAALAGPPASIVLAGGDGQRGNPGTVLPTPIRFHVADRYNNPAGGVTVAFVVTKGGGSASPSSGLTDATGNASTSWTLGPLLFSIQALEGSVSGLPPAAVASNAFTATGVRVNFSVDDRANKVFTDGQMTWKGSMKYDAGTRELTYDSMWAGPWPTLYDDGPWDQGGHEPLGAVVGDHIWGITVFVNPPATGTLSYQYGVIDNLYEAQFLNGWIWVGPNGVFTVAAGSTMEMDATGLTLPKFGTTDMRLVLDTNTLEAGTVWDSSKITVKSSALNWSEVAVVKDVAGIATFVLSDNVGVGTVRSHNGLLSTGAQPEFVWVLNGVEYRLAGGFASFTGVTAATRASGSMNWTNLTITRTATYGNTCITVP